MNWSGVWYTLFVFIFIVWLVDGFSSRECMAADLVEAIG